jgi:hypothetical protein
MWGTEDSGGELGPVALGEARQNIEQRGIIVHLEAGFTVTREPLQKAEEPQPNHAPH